MKTREREPVESGVGFADTTTAWTSNKQNIVREMPLVALKTTHPTGGPDVGLEEQEERLGDAVNAPPDRVRRSRWHGPEDDVPPTGRGELGLRV